MCMEQGHFLTIQQCTNQLENTIHFGTKRQSRLFTDIVLVMDFVYLLLSEGSTATLREVFYALKPRIHCQAYSNQLILKLANILGVSRRSLGIVASSKGLMGGCIVITRKKTLPSGEEDVETMDGNVMLTPIGMHITHEWLERDENGTTQSGVKVNATTTAKVILIIEKEGIFLHLLAARIFEKFPCILVTGKGYPDIATRALVWSLHKELHLPVVGLCDYNPYGIHVLGTYYFSNRSGIDGGSRYSVPIQWLGLRPSHINPIKDCFQSFVFQLLTDGDLKLIDSLMQGKGYLKDGDCDAILAMKNHAFKLELEALHQLRHDLLCTLVLHMLEQYNSNNK
jgi:meiotic recombination protein SPO11